MFSCRGCIFFVSWRVFFFISIRVLVFFKNWHIFLTIHAILRYSCLRVVFIFLSVSCRVFYRVLVIFSYRIKFIFVLCRIFFLVLIRVLVFFKNWHIFLAIHAILRYSYLRVVFIFLFVSYHVFCRVLIIFLCHVKFVFVSYRRIVLRIVRSMYWELK